MMMETSPCQAIQTVNWSMPDPVCMTLMTLAGQNFSEKGTGERGVNMWLGWGDFRQKACSFPTSESFLECLEGSPPTQQLLREGPISHARGSPLEPLGSPWEYRVSFSYQTWQL